MLLKEESNPPKSLVGSVQIFDSRREGVQDS